MLGNRLKLYYATQVDVAPPTIVLFVNQPRHAAMTTMLHDQSLPRTAPLPEVPIKIISAARRVYG